MTHAEMSTVAACYKLKVESGDIQADAAQRPVIAGLDRVLSYVSTKRVSRKSSALGWLFARQQTQSQNIKGLYIHGSVGRGKTMLMDMFFSLVPAKRKRRMHFNDFMADVHHRINAHRERFKAGETRQKDPMPPVASDIYEEAWVLCFDEFSVTDIADAMILSRLFEQLFAKGCILIATSNVEPRNLYKDGLNRSLFLPFIDLLGEHVDVLDLDSDTDYRMIKTEQLPVYVTPLGDHTDAVMDAAFKQLTDGKQISHKRVIEVKGRQIKVPVSAGSVARFTFDDLCAKPLGASDYMAISDQFSTLMIDHVPQLGPHKRNEAKRFITLIDTLYDRKKRLFMSAAKPSDDLYEGSSGTEGFEFARTSSRLFEMQSKDYLESIEVN